MLPTEPPLHRSVHRPNPEQPSDLCLNLLHIYWEPYRCLRQSNVNLVDDLSNGTSQILVHKKDESSYCLTLWIKNIQDLCIEPWIKVLDSLQQLPRICWYFIQSPEGQFDGWSKAARCFTSAAFSLVSSLSWNPFRAPVSQSTHQ